MAGALRQVEEGASAAARRGMSAASTTLERMTDSPSPTPQPSTAEHPWPVSRMATLLKDYIARLGSVWVEGEIVQWNVRRGTVYGKLKDVDDDVTVAFTIWSSTHDRLDGEYAQGDRVVTCIKPDYWLRGGSLSMIVSNMRHVGLGELLERLERLRRQLAEEGLFAPERKHPLPFLPQRIGLITGAHSDAEKDVLRNATLRWPQVQFRTIYTAVQGDNVPDEVVAAIATLDSDPDVDVIIIARGGGDFQHLLGFSDERVIRAAAAATTPIVSAIGHENDRPLLDEVADLRASTPTDAAKRVVPDVAEEQLRVTDARRRMTAALWRRLDTEQQRLEALRSRPVLAHPTWIVDQRGDDIARLTNQLDVSIERQLERSQALVAELHGRLQALSPTATLARGYAIAMTRGGLAVRSPADAPTGTDLHLYVQHGQLAATSNGPIDTGSPSDK